MKGIVNVLSAGCIKGLFKNIGDFVPNPLDRAVRMSEKVLDGTVKSVVGKDNEKDNVKGNEIE
jgi:hypothetical protein